VGWCESALCAGDIESNDFEIVVRDMTPQRCREMDVREEALRAGGDLILTNFFGAQRFGSARHGEGFAGRAIAKGDYETALRLLIGTPHRKDMGMKRAFTRGLATGWGDWSRLAGELPRCPDRRAVEALARGRGFREAFAELPFSLQELSVDAYQSWLWNRATARWLERAIDPRERFESEDDFGAMVFAGLRALSAEILQAITPLPRAGCVGDTAWMSALDEVLRGEGLTRDELRVPGLRRPRWSASERSVFARASGFVLSRPREDDLRPRRLARSLTFSLPSASYATVVLRALGE
jgi:tRNA pseudouridine13 synthase